MIYWLITSQTYPQTKTTTIGKTPITITIYPNQLKTYTLQQPIELFITLALILII